MGLFIPLDILITMRFFMPGRIIVFLVCLLFVCSGYAQQPVKILKSNVVEQRNGKQYFVHTVKKGQTIYSISKIYEVSPDEVYFENPNARDGINVNQQLWIPTINKETEVSTEIKTASFEFFYHIAANNETFDHISSIYVIPEDKIRRANPELQDPLKEGEYVKVPVDVPETQPSNPPATYESRPRLNAIQRPGRETVTFNPNIPVIPDYRHVVIAGETTKSIADKYKVSVDQLKAVNPGLTNTVEKGDRLRVPISGSLETVAVAKPGDGPQIIDPVDADTLQNKTIETKKEIAQEPEFIMHMVKKKETLYSISREYGVGVQDLYDANKGLSDNIKIGQLIKVPKKKITSPFIQYKVKEKTRLSSVAKQYGISYHRLKEDNPGLGRKVYPGQLVRVAVGDKADVVPFIAEAEKPIDIDPKEIISIQLNNNCDAPEPDYHTTFKVALMIPLYLEEFDSLNTSQFLSAQHDKFLPFKYLNFYEGALLAVDSLRNQGMHIELYVYDVDQSITKTSKVLSRPELRDIDLIIGPFYHSSFTQVALFAGNFNIPIVNPLSFRDEMVDKYKSVYKVKPNPLYQNQLLSELISEKYKDYKIFLITQTPYKDADKVIALQNELIESIPPLVRFSNEDLYNLAIDIAYRHKNFDASSGFPGFSFEGRMLQPNLLHAYQFDSTIMDNSLVRINYLNDSLHPFIKQASALRKNLVIIYGDNKSFVMDAMNRLNELRDTFNIHLIGMPTWERFGDLDLRQSVNLNMAYFSASFLDYNRREVQQFVSDFIKYYGVEPDAYGFSGFDVTYYFLHALFNLSHRFESCIDQLPPMKLLESTYKFQRSINPENFENTYWNVLYYDGYNEVIIPQRVYDKRMTEN